jgi:diguanylate cyclase (GGDEF)-like protein
MNEKNHSLEAQLAETEDVSRKLALYNEIIQELQNSDLPRAISLCEEAVSLAQETYSEDVSLQEEYAESIFTLGMLNAKSGNYIKAVTILFDSLAMFEEIGNAYLHARAINVIAASNGYLGNYYEAINYFLKALELFKEINNELWEAAVLNNIGYQYWHIENYEWALKYLHRSLQQVERIQNKTLLGDVHETLCNLYYSMGAYDDALSNGMKSLSIYEEIGDNHGQAEVLNSIGDVYTALNEHAQAISYFNKALKVSQEVGHKHEEVETLLRIGRYYARSGQTKDALRALKDALAAAEELGVKRCIYECHQEMARIYKSIGDFENALEHFEKFYDVHKDVFNENETNRIESLEVMHQVETARKDAEIFRLKNVALQNEIDERKKVQAALKKLAITDPLTSLFNRRHFFELAGDELQKSRMNDHHFSVILADIDDFKQVNDRFGHTAGDQVLINLSERMREAVRKEDTLARYGGEEFIILLPDINTKEAKQIAERLRENVAEYSIEVEGNLIQVSISVGVAYFMGETDVTVETLLNRADMTMYEAKQDGGNQVYVWQDGSVN